MGTRLTLQERLARDMLEETLLGHVQATAAQFGWRFAHFRPAMTKKGWRTAVQGDQGFPDVVLANGKRVLFVELKRELGKLGDGQAEWLNALDVGRRDQSGDAIEVFIWRPSDWQSGAIERELQA